MSALRPKHYLLPLIALRSYAHLALARSQARELRLLQRCVAAARLGLRWLRPTIQLSIYMSLR